MGRFFSLLLVLSATGAVFAQSSSLSGDGRRPVEKPGLALVKPQKWSPPNQAQAVRFTAYTNRGGYFVLRLPNGQERQVWVAQMVGEAPVLQPELPSTLVDRTLRDDLANQVLEIQKLAKTAPAADRALEDYAKPLQEMIARFDAGEVFVDGRWESVEAHRTRQFERLEAQIRRAISEEKTKARFNLAENSSFKTLQDLAKDQPELLEKIQALRNDFARLVSLERQEEILQQLSQPGLTDQMADSLITRLQTYSDPGQRTSRVLDQAMTARSLAAKSAEVQKALESFFANKTVETALPALPPDLAEGIQTLGDEARKFQASSPPAGIRLPNAVIDAATDLMKETPAVNTLLTEKKMVEAANLLNRLSEETAAIGPTTRGALIRLQTMATTKVDLFTKFRAEGEEAESKGDIPGAISKFQAALEISVNPELKARIQRLENPQP